MNNKQKEIVSVMISLGWSYTHTWLDRCYLMMDHNDIESRCSINKVN